MSCEIILSKDVALPFRNNHRMLPKWNNDIFNITSPGQQTCFVKKSLFFISTLPLVLNTNSLFCKKHAKPTIFLTEKCFKSFKIFKLCFFNKKSANAKSALNLHEKHKKIMAFRQNSASYQAQDTFFKKTFFTSCL